MNRRVMPTPLGQQANYRVNRQGAREGLFQPLYDFTTYAAAGQTSLQFFAQPKGQGGKTIADTNLELAGQLPNHKTFELRSVELAFFPGVDPAAFGAQAKADFINDVYAFAKSGSLELFIGSKTYLEDAPLGKFPPMFRLDVEAALADVTTAGADLQSRIAYAAVCGVPYEITPILLESNQNFSVDLRWPTAVALPSGEDARIGVILNGIMTRTSQ